MAFVPHVDRDATTEKIKGELDEHGAVIVEGLLDPDTLARFNAELDPLLAAASPKRSFVNPAVEFFFGDKTRHLTGMAAKSRVFAEEILPHPTYMGVCDAVLSPACASYQVNIAHVLDRGPGAEQQMFHRDELVWSHLPRPHPRSRSRRSSRWWTSRPRSAQPGWCRAATSGPTSARSNRTRSP